MGIFGPPTRPKAPGKNMGEKMGYPILSELEYESGK